MRKKPIKGLSRDEIKKEISGIEEEIKSVHLLTDNLDIAQLSHELIALDYQRSIFKKVERQYYSHQFKNDSLDEISWFFYNPETDSYEEKKIDDILESSSQISMF